MIIERDSYLQKLVSADGNGMIKIVTGIRRCGKSFLLFNIFYNYLISHGVAEDHIIGLVLDARENLRLLNPDNLLEYINQHIVKDGKKTYIILDEVQLVDEFVSVLLSLSHKANVETYVSGSNSKFLSKDVVTEFRGRGWEIRVRPLSFAEYYAGVGGDKYDALHDYYTYGGLPGIVNMPTIEDKMTYLQEIYRTIYLKDIIERNHLQNEDGLEQILRVLASQMGSSVNVNKIANTFQSTTDIKISSHTVSKYVECLKDAFIVSEALRFDVKGRKYIGADSKFYFEDAGIRNAILGFRQVEYTHIMENVLYNELCARGYSVDVGMVDVWEKNKEGKRERKKLEVDYVLNRGSQRIYIQSAYMLPDTEKVAQEQRPLISINDNFRKIIISGDYRGKFYNDEGICRMGIFDFLMDKNSLVD